MPSDIEIAQKAQMRKIVDIAKERLGIHEDSLENYGRYKAKVSFSHLNKLKNDKDGKLILVTAISPTPAGEGKTTTTVGLGDALNFIGKKTMICLREPSLGPVFGIKGGAAGGGLAQIVTMEDINFHFTGDFAAIAAAHNLLAAMLDNHIYHGNELAMDIKTIQWKRTVDMNDRALRKITLGLGKIIRGEITHLVMGNLNSLRDWGHAKDYCYGIWLMLQQDKPDDFILSTNKMRSIKEFIEIAFKLKGFSIKWKGSGIDEVGYDENTNRVLIIQSSKYYRPAEVDQLLGDYSKAKRILNWEPKITFEEMVKEMVENDCS